MKKFEKKKISDDLLSQVKDYVKMIIVVDPNNIAADGEKVYVRITNPINYHECYQDKEGYVVETKGSGEEKLYLVDFEDKKVPPILLHPEEFELVFHKKAAKDAIEKFNRKEEYEQALKDYEVSKKKYSIYRSVESIVNSAISDSELSGQNRSDLISNITENLFDQINNNKEKKAKKDILNTTKYFIEGTSPYAFKKFQEKMLLIDAINKCRFKDKHGNDLNDESKVRLSKIIKEEKSKKDWSDHAEEIMKRIVKFLDEYNKEKEEHKKMKDFKNTLPMIPSSCGTSTIDNSIYTYVDQTNDDDVFEIVGTPITVTDGYTKDLLDKYNYIFGNFFRNPDKAYLHRNRVSDHINKMVEKAKDWAQIVRKQYQKENIYQDKKDRLNIKSSLDNIFDSKFAIGDENKEIVYYKFIVVSEDGWLKPEFKLVKTKVENIEPDYSKATICFDYASGNFFLTAKEAKTSIMFKKLKTFFKYDGEEDLILKDFQIHGHTHF